MASKKLDPALVDKIIKLLTETTDSQRLISLATGVSQGTVHNICIKNKIIRPLETKESIDSVKLNPTDKRILQLEQQVVSLKDERTNIKAAYKAAQRSNGIFQALAEEIKDIVKPISPLPVAKKINYHGKKIQESLVMLLSDEHAADIILPHQVGGLEHYDFNIALKRAETLVDSTLRFTQKILRSYQFDTLFVLSLGDHVSGEIHKAVDHTTYRNVFRNCIATGQMQALMLRDLAPYFKNIKVICVSGNHGRKTPKKDYQNPRDNYDYLVAETAFAYCRDLVNVEFIIPDSFSANVDIEGHGFCISHGDDVRSYMGIPWYGIERKTRRLAALNNAVDKRVDNYVFGHFHNIAIQDVLRGEVLINGAWVATSPYAYNSLSTFNEPAQVIFGVHRTWGITWRLHVKLKSENEEGGSHRYSVIMAK